jgi:hypothetical protein
MSFRESVLQDNLAVFSNVDEFADLRTVVYDGEEYEEVPVVMTQLKEKDRSANVKDHAQGLYLVNAIAHFPADKLGNHVPEKGCKISITDDDDFPHTYYVAQSGCDLGMVRLELEAYDE